MAHISNTASTGFNPIVWVRGLIASAQDYMVRRAAYNSVYGELSRLGDRELNDMGISRADFHAIAAETAARA